MNNGIADQSIIVFQYCIAYEFLMLFDIDPTPWVETHDVHRCIPQ